MDKGLLSFDIKTGMKNIIGRDLITDDFIAIYELVKNSYDAHADYVKIIFNKDEIIIADNGKGMSKQDLEKKWFAVAYSAKKDKTEDDDLKKDSHLNNLKSRRFFAGAKGVGRFSCDRLGGKLELITTKVDINETYKVDVDWNAFEKDAQQSFDSIQIPFERIENNVFFSKNKKHGTILKIQDLNSLWDLKKLSELRRSLEKLINPFSKENSFTVEIEAKDFIEIDNNSTNNLKINGVVDNSILKVLDLKTTQIDLRLKNEIITTKIIDRGTLIYHIEEPNNYSSLIDDLEINLYFLNRSAKINFGKLMDIEPVNYGNVFLFKNGFRVQPYGNPGDDSWEIDRRKQQGYNRFLGTRELFGKVDLITEDFNEFKEVSSRDGGLVESAGKKILFEIFKEKAFLRLERYVVGVLWGEGFIRKNYFLDTNIASDFREKLSSDKDKDLFEDALNNLGSKIDFVNLIRALTDDKNIKIIGYNTDLVNLVNEKLDIIQPKFISDLEKIAEKTNDSDLFNQIRLTEDNFNKILKEKEDAEKREEEERKKRVEAEKQAEIEKYKREEAEQKQKEEEEKRIKAEFEAKENDLKRREEEIKRKEAEQKAENRKIQLDRFRSSETITYKDLRDSNHIIGVYSDDISKKIQLIKRKTDKKGSIDKKEFFQFIQEISLVNEKINTLTKFTTKSGFLQARLSTTENVVDYIENYVKNIYGSLHKEMKYEFSDNKLKFEKEFQPIELSVVLDNILNNSKKKGASKVIFGFEKVNENLLLSIKDLGKQLDNSIAKELIFEEGITSTKGAGLGLSHVKRILENDLNATIEYNPDYSNGFELIITFKK
ncbi:Histidine kinase-, DNA gyrase B-, and HSP90-like ATPase [Flavobacterium swingsii]|uniref:Histidine kinase-, DNA gyrase B-, and HSP90-like ATPase n=1 Tax=Flavobacterium swingsii TaxID=498292 RepID=A0A1I0ZH43_9FLAO|nr:ATP-binding protein [Flavobacterium swingsii]SFB23523.1 Histidine kinase-, DNA gyrase B-, and HSP90-like ATPase [Flavobacterium swingsii]